MQTTIQPTDILIDEATKEKHAMSEWLVIYNNMDANDWGGVCFDERGLKLYEL